jgi:hypothetical protein
MLLLSVVVLATVLTVTYLSIGEGQSSLALALGEDNLALVEGCAEDVLQEIHDSSTYAGTTITRPEGTCSISYSLSGPTNWDVAVTSTDARYKRKIRLIFTRSTTAVTLTSWQEI